MSYSIKAPFELFDHHGKLMNPANISAAQRALLSDEHNVRLDKFIEAQSVAIRAAKAHNAAIDALQSARSEMDAAVMRKEKFHPRQSRIAALREVIAKDAERRANRRAMLSR